MSFVLTPNLPQAEVTHVIASPKYRKIISSLESLKISVLNPNECADVLAPVSLHADMLVHHLGGKKMLIERSQLLLKNQLCALGAEFDFDDVQLKSEYPHDVRLNCCRVGNSVICKQKYADKNVLFGRNVIDVKQGYAKCSVCVVDENSVITDDDSIAFAATAAGLDVLKVQKGAVVLEGFGYGFFGGCCGKLSPDTIAFCGAVESHPNYTQIRSFAAQRGVNLLSLCGDELLDIGSIIPICEK